MSAPGIPLARITQQDIVKLDGHFEFLSPNFGKSSKHRTPEMTLDEATRVTRAQLASDEIASNSVGLDSNTANKHYTKLQQIHRFLQDKVSGIPKIDFSKFQSSKNESDQFARLRFTVQQGRAIFSLPPWAGSNGLDRLTVGNDVYHDAFFYVFLLAWYTGARREEICKLMTDDVAESYGVPHLDIRVTKAGKLKNKGSARLIPLADEIIRLGFLQYVDKIRAIGGELLFPELDPQSETQGESKYGAVYYKKIWTLIVPEIPDRLQKQTFHSTRHVVADELKQAEVYIEFRNDLLGHAGKGEGVRRYPSPTDLQKLKELVNIIPNVTDHLPDQSTIRLLPDAARQPPTPRKTRQTKS